MNVKIKGEAEHTIVLTHGFRTDKSIWDKIVPVLSEHYRVVVLGWCFSGTVKDVNLFDPMKHSSYNAFANDLNLILSEKGLTSTVFVRRTQRFKRLVLLCASPKCLNIDRYEGGFGIEDIEQILGSIETNYDEWTLYFASLVVNSKNLSAVEVYWNYLRRTKPEFMLAVAKTVLYSNQREILPKVTTTIIQTTNDSAVPNSVRYCMQGWIAGKSTVEIIEIDGHYPQLTASNQLLDLLGSTDVFLSAMAPLVREVRFPELHIPVTITSKFSVQPSRPIPVATGDHLYLSNLDDVIGARVFTPTVYFYRSSDGGAPSEKVIGILHDALASVLVPYYPLSGRLRETKKGKLEVFFGPDQGGLLVEAWSGKSLDDLGDLTVPNPAWEPLVFKFQNEEPYKLLDMPLVIAQVTVFSCGGFSLGLRLCHCICDGLGAMQFLRAWAATAKAGSLIADPYPCWDREVFKPRDPPRINFPHTEFMRIEEGSNLTERLWGTKPVQNCYRISQEFQAQLKTRAQTDSFLCTAFDALAAHVWRSWVKALDVRPSDYHLRLTFSVNARRKLEIVRLKDGFYGNVVCVACAVSTVSELAKGGLPRTASLVRNARLGISEEYLRSMVDYVEVHRPTRLEFGGKLTITQWTRFSIYESADFGWGRPVYAGPIDLTPTPQVCVLLPEGEADPSGSMILCICLPKSATERFKELFFRVNWRSDDFEGQYVHKMVE